MSVKRNKFSHPFWRLVLPALVPGFMLLFFSGLVKNFSSFLKLLGRVVRLYYEITQRERSQRLDGFQLQV